jgi:hypothetical protein
MLYSKYRYSKHLIPLPWTTHTLHACRSVSRVDVYTRAYFFALYLLVSFTLKMEAIRSSEMSVLIRATRRHLPEDDNHHKSICLPFGLHSIQVCSSHLKQKNIHVCFEVFTAIYKQHSLPECNTTYHWKAFLMIWSQQVPLKCQDIPPILHSDTLQKILH